MKWTLSEEYEEEEEEDENEEEGNNEELEEPESEIIETFEKNIKTCRGCAR